MSPPTWYGKAAVGERDVGALFEHDDLGVFVEASGAGGGGHAASNSAHNDDAHGYSLGVLSDAGR